MKTKARNPVIVVGGGPAGSVAALCLRKLGRDVVVFEREKFPRYRLGESLLPGTMSILNRLGVMDRVEAANFVKKSAATFIWGPEQAPWTFTFATPRTAPWVYDHAYQVTRAEYDQILLDAARERGADVREEHEVTDIRVGADGGPVSVAWRNNGSTGALEGDFVIDASGTRGIVARKLGLRRFDRYFQNLAVWSYFRGGKRFGGDLEGNIFSVTCQEGWIWIIPLKDDIYSVGVVSDKASSARMREIGVEAFYRESLARCRLARDVLNGAERCDKVRVIRDWAYDASSVAMGRAFLCGDSACFIDPLFSQGVHLATYSAMLASAGSITSIGVPATPTRFEPGTKNPTARPTTAITSSWPRSIPPIPSCLPTFGGIARSRGRPTADSPARNGSRHSPASMWRATPKASRISKSAPRPWLISGSTTGTRSTTSSTKPNSPCAGCDGPAA